MVAEIGGYKRDLCSTGGKWRGTLQTGIKDPFLDDPAGITTVLEPKTEVR